MKTYKSSSMIIPKEWDIESCPTLVYHNFNVVENETEEGIVYSYDVEEYTSKEYIEYLQNKNATSIKDLEDAVCELGEIIGG